MPTASVSRSPHVLLVRTASQRAVRGVNSPPLPPLRRTQSAPGPLAPPRIAGMVLVQNVQIVRQMAADSVASVQEERRRVQVPLLSNSEARELGAAVLGQLHRLGMGIRLGIRLEEKIAAHELQTVTRFFKGTWGLFYRSTVRPLVEQVQRATDTGDASAPADAERVERVMGLVQFLFPRAARDRAWGERAAATLLKRCDHHALRPLKDFRAAFERSGCAPLMARLNAWASALGQREGVEMWAQQRADALRERVACDRRLATHPDSMPTLERRAELFLERLHAPLQALQDAHRLVQLAPTEDHYVARAKAYMALERWNEADDDLQKAIDGAPRHGAAHALRAMIRVARGDLAGAQRSLRRARQRDAYDPTVRHAELHLEAHELTLHLQGHPHDVDALLHRSLCRGGQGDFTGALRDCRRARQLAPESAQTHAGCAMYASLLGIEPNGLWDDA